MKQLILLTPFILILFSCASDKDKADAYGNFETTETLVSAMGNGTLMSFEVKEGEQLHAGDTLGYIDTTDLHLKKEQLKAQIEALRSALPEAGIQLQVIEQQLDHAQREQKRLQRLLSDSAATQKQKEDMDAQVGLLQKKYASMKSSLSTQTQSILSKIKPLQIQIAQVKEKLQDYTIINPVKGIVLTKYAEPHELVSYGKPLYAIGNLSDMILRAYVTGNQLPGLKIGDTVMIRTDKPEGGYEKWNGVISWISSQSEFTPKEIQTKEERVNRVYAVKILVQNDGTIKIGMPGEVMFTNGNRR